MRQVLSHALFKVNWAPNPRAALALAAMVASIGSPRTIGTIAALIVEGLKLHEAITSTFEQRSRRASKRPLTTQNIAS